MWKFHEVWNCKLKNMIFQSCTFYSLALGVRKFERKLVGRYYTVVEIDGLIIRLNFFNTFTHPTYATYYTFIKESKLFKFIKVIGIKYNILF